MVHNPPHRIAEAKRRTEDNTSMWNRKLPPLGSIGAADTSPGPGYDPLYLQPLRHCDDCDFSTRDPDIISCPHDKGSVG